MNNPPVILWFRNDLRVTDNPALNNALKISKNENRKIICIYILENYKDFSSNPGSASKWWLHGSLKKLDQQLTKLNEEQVSSSLNFFVGDPQKIILNLCKKYESHDVFWNRRYETEHVMSDKQVKLKLKNNKVSVKTYIGSVLIEPWNVLGKKNQRLKVFTPYKNSLINNHTIQIPFSKPSKLSLIKIKESISLNNLKLISGSWTKKFENKWEIGEEIALKKIDDFINKKIDHYHLDRNMMAKDGTSKLSPHFNFGEISPRYIWQKIIKEDVNKISEGKKIFLSEIIWREFAINLMLLFPNLSSQNMNPSFKNFNWMEDEINFKKWKTSKTGFPVVDAAMSQLWNEGWMHNRARMIVASFLTKHLLIPWQWGANWFHDTLLDANLASNYASWQWVAGCGADAAPYFRIFNPETQAIKFDPEGSYIKKHLPIFKKFDKKNCHNPDQSVLKLNYPKKIIDHKFARSRALKNFSEARKKQ